VGRQLLRSARWIVTLPWALFRRRISYQLITSYIFVVVLSVLLLEAAAIASLFGYFPSFLPEETTYLDETMGDKARAIALLVGSDAVTRAVSGTWTPIERSVMSVKLREVVDLENGATAGSSRPLQLEGVARVAIVAPSGRVVASSQQSWVPPGASIEYVTSSKVAQVTREVIRRDGAPDPTTHERYALAVQDRVTVAAYPVLDPQGRLVGVVAVQRWPLDTESVFSTRSLLKQAARSNLRFFWIVTIPALLLAIPFGVWRARTISKRLTAVADAAEAMARGDLSRRLPASGQDEISVVSRRFNDMADRLAAVDRARNSFAANVSHELRTPIAIIQGNVERLLGRELERQSEDPVGDGAGDEDNLETLNVVHQEAITLSRLIDDLFTLTRIEDSALPVEISRVRVNEVVERVVAGIKVLAWDQRKVTVQSIVQPGLPPVKADLTRFQQMLTNLLYNALRHTPEGGLIIVDAAVREHDIEVSVTDTGVGIPPEKLETLFDRYYPSNRESGRGGGGSGLGLHLVKQLAEAQGGSIAIQSTVGQGTTVRFTLPLA
jgi:signal transduction histidine kinase